MTDRCSASAQVAHEAITFSYLLVMAWNIHEWTSEVILFQLQKNVNTQFFKFKFTDVNLLCTVWLVCWTKWQILHYDWSNCLSIKVPAKGQFQTENSVINVQFWKVYAWLQEKSQHFKEFFFLIIIKWLCIPLHCFFIVFLCKHVDRTIVPIFYCFVFTHLTCWTLICAFAPSSG